ncbi:DUF6461 domain-containing protein [Nonomuraea roseoviolacea]|uniref:Uncharacterized protein n=1 Tax=Nonomuraea roseoviolacea subsp. carminata TaxID=160689 RepID=A0ABT1K868_9ACTN|nr:DUF6461 domain-containing protein [Nonomuraea roseoviolacea]MCP2349872.1 hypothetical protein [Nonomuraea roseoviolacea subsp. carminata]
MTTDPLAPYRWLAVPAGHEDDLLDEIFCLSFIRGLEPAEVLRRFPAPEARPEAPQGWPQGREMSLDEYGHAAFEFGDRYGGALGGGHVGVVRAGDWCVALELFGGEAVRGDTLARLSSGCEVVAVLRHDYANHRVAYALDGETVTCFNPYMPDMRSGSDPDRLNELMREVGLPPEPATGDEDWNDLYSTAVARSFHLAARITGVVPTPRMLSGPLLVGPVRR